MEEDRKKPELVVEEQVPFYYANATRISTSINDVTFLFGRGGPADLASDAVAVHAVCALSMSPAQAKSLFLLLRQQLLNYEKQFGRIPVVPDIEEKYGGDLDDE